MRRKLFFVLAVLAAALLPLGAHAQTITTVSGTVTDPSGIPYAGGQLTATVVPPNGGVSPYVTATGAPLIAPSISNLDANGTFSVGLVANASITPASTHYTFRVCAPFVQPPIGSGTQSCFTVTGVTISGATQSLTATLDAAAPALTHLVQTTRVTKTAAASYTVLPTDDLILANGANNQDIVLPAPSAVPIGKRFTVKMLVGTFTGTGPVNITATGGAALDVWSGGQYQLGFVTGNSIPTTTATGASVTFESDGTQYWIVAQI